MSVEVKIRKDMEELLRLNLVYGGFNAPPYVEDELKKMNKLKDDFIYSAISRENLFGQCTEWDKTAEKLLDENRKLVFENNQLKQIKARLALYMEMYPHNDETFIMQRIMQGDLNVSSN